MQAVVRDHRFAAAIRSVLICNYPQSGGSHALNIRACDHHIAIAIEFQYAQPAPSHLKSPRTIRPRIAENQHDKLPNQPRRYTRLNDFGHR
jgi:hypothetical protein